MLAIGPLLVAVAAASIALTAWALGKADRAAARSRAEQALRTYATERAEGDSEANALEQVFAAADADGVRLFLRGKGAERTHGALGLPPPQLLELAPGECGSAGDQQGKAWQACTVRRAELTAVAAISTEAHAAVLELLAFGMGLVVLLALGGAVYAARMAVAKPLAGLRHLAAWSEHVTRAEQPSPPPEIQTEELARLAAAFDTLVQRLLSALARERTSSAHIAHEFRTPLTAIRAELEALPSANGDAVARMRRDIERLARVVESILVLSAPPDAAVPDTVVNVSDVVRASAPASTAVDAPDEALVRGDEHLIALALRNLFENAERYAGRAATLARVSLTDDQVRVAVCDDGPGIADTIRPKMFDAYWRGPGVGERAGPGSGLGLAFVRAVAERHGGLAAARQNPTGQGLEVSFTLGHVLGWHAETAAAGEIDSRG